jgi:hypothetical protein
MLTPYPYSYVDRREPQSSSSLAGLGCEDRPSMPRHDPRVCQPVAEQNRSQVFNLSATSSYLRDIAETVPQEQSIFQPTGTRVKQQKKDPGYTSRYTITLPMMYFQ